MRDLVMEYAKIVLFVFIIVALVMPVIIKIAHHVNALDMPNERKVHKEPIPRMGGLAIFIGFFSRLYVIL